MCIFPQNISCFRKKNVILHTKSALWSHKVCGKYTLGILNHNT
jgi:hypothetical protein